MTRIAHLSTTPEYDALPLDMLNVISFAFNRISVVSILTNLGCWHKKLFLVWQMYTKKRRGSLNQRYFRLQVSLHGFLEIDLTNIKYQILEP